MDNGYQDPHISLKYLDFLNSPNGKIQKTVLFAAIFACLPKNPNIKILDAGCGPGWLAGELQKKFQAVWACDNSEFLINFAKTHHKGINFKVTDLTRDLPYEKFFFDAAILNMAAPDLNKLAEAFKNLAAVLKPAGKFLITIPNPALTYPAAEWKRGFWGFIFRRKPKLVIKKTPQAGNIQREFGANVKITSYYYTLDDYLNAAAQAGLTHLATKKIRTPKDSMKFDLNYQLYRHPLLLLLEFKKLG